MKLSIVIPIYNVERYLKKCLDSIYSQIVDLPVEVILVNDGTRDNSMSVLKSYLNYPQTIFIDQHNQGLSVARNNGLKRTSGEYVWFVDSDDWIPAGFVDSFLQLIETENADIFSYNIESFDESGVRVDDGYFKFPDLQGMKRCTGAESMLIPKYNITPIQRHIFSHAFLNDNNLFFRNGIFHEDIDFASRTLILSNNVLMINRYNYCYLLRDSGSITSSFNIKRVYDLVDIMDHLYKWSSSLSGISKQALQKRQALTLLKVINLISLNNVNLECEDIDFSFLSRKIAIEGVKCIDNPKSSFKLLILALFPTSYKYLKFIFK